MNTLLPSTGTTRLIRSGHTCLGVARPGGLILTTGDRNSSPLWSRTVGTSGGQLHTWSPWGAGTPLPGLPGFNGERPDPVSGSYHLGNGYRAYNPLLMRFNCPDNLSPFGAGGINPYAYCAGDPVNHTDPTGHLSWQGILGIVVSTIGLALAAFSAGSSIAAAGSITAAITTAPLATATGGLAVVADATGIASVATENSNPSASAVLGWVSLGTGVAALAAGIGQAGSRATARVRQRLGNLREEGLSGRGAPAAVTSWHSGEMRNSDFVGEIQRAVRPTDAEITALRNNISLLRQRYETRVNRPVPSRWRFARRTASMSDFPPQARSAVPLYFVEQGGELTYIAAAPRYSREFLARMPMHIDEHLLYTNTIPTGAHGLLRGMPGHLSDLDYVRSPASSLSPPPYSEVAGGLPTYAQATANLPTYAQAMEDSNA
ncbi:RHS repeat-associated core domain-containing protein [Yokenella regensburgei]|uniref:RHS repeat-associated core domain-containing protein n=1 Tax=Yokenella regensburgei TaxID=158877 RepID=UPI00143280F4|nr:RHS repeat-associated core domain-containing protein [Yokenella regensburgei]QIU88443.1 hypothetical protein HEC60_03250 [Yokenella regensburgei]